MKIFIAGHNGMAGSAIYRNLSKLEDNTIVCSARAKLDLLDQNQVADFMSTEKPDIVIICENYVIEIDENQHKKHPKPGELYSKENE